MARALATVLSLAMALVPAVAAAKTKKKVDPLELARVLLRDGLASRAITVLAELDPAKDESHAAEFHRLRGLAEHELSRYAEAAASFELAIQHGETTPPTWYALANAQHSAGEHRNALSTLERGPKEIWAIAGAHRIKAQAYHRLGEPHRAFEAADAGLLRFPTDVELERFRVLLLFELGLSQEGLEAARKLLARRESTAKDHLGLAEALTSRRDLDGAAKLLEAALLVHPDDREVRKQLARTYFEHGRHLSAARVLHPLALEEPASALIAADLYRRAGKLEQALRMNALVADQKDKVRQRLNLLIESERHREAAALDDRLSRLGLLADQGLLYALAYAHLISGNKTRVEQLLGRISDPELFAKATAIRRELEACAREVWACE